MERKDVLNLEKLCLENDNLLAFPLAADLLGVPYANLYKFFRSGRNEGLFLREKVGAMYYIKFAPSLPQTGPPLDFNMIERVYSRYVYHYPDRAKRCVVALLAQFPGQFEMTTVEKINKRGSTYFAPAVQAVRKGVI